MGTSKWEVVHQNKPKKGTLQKDHPQEYPNMASKQITLRLRLQNPPLKKQIVFAMWLCLLNQPEGGHTSTPRRGTPLLGPTPCLGQEVEVHGKPRCEVSECHWVVSNGSTACGFSILPNPAGFDPSPSQINHRVSVSGSLKSLVLEPLV